MNLFKKKTNNEPSMSEEVAQVIQWEPKWDTGAPMPQVFSNGSKIFLIYYIFEPDPNWDGTYITSIDNRSKNEYPLALVEFDGGTFRFGIANDEVFGGLPIADKGMEWYAAHIIQNSLWLDEIKKIHKVHSLFSEDHWKDRKHFMLLFHDEILEVIATNYKIETYKTTFEDLAIEVAKRLNK